VASFVYLDTCGETRKSTIVTSTICSTKTKWPKDLYTFSIIGTGTWYHGTERIIRIVSRKILSFDFIFLSFNFCWFFTTRFIRAVMSQFTHNTHTIASCQLTSQVSFPFLARKMNLLCPLTRFLSPFPTTATMTMFFSMFRCPSSLPNGRYALLVLLTLNHPRLRLLTMYFLPPTVPLVRNNALRKKRDARGERERSLSSLPFLGFDDKKKSKKIFRAQITKKLLLLSL